MPESCAKESSSQQRQLTDVLQAWATEATAVELDWQPSYDERIWGFDMGTDKALFASINRCGQLILSSQFPDEVNEQHTEVFYALRETSDLETKKVQSYVYGCVDGSFALDSLKEQMETLFAPAFLSASCSWPVTLHQDFVGQLHKFTSTLVETVHEQHGHTVLYVPQDLLEDSVSSLGHHRELVQQLESSLLRWTEQINELLNRQNTDDLILDDGPLDEVNFWNVRADNLGGIQSQLQDEKLLHAVALLESAKSQYLAAFLKLKESIHEESAKANSNVQFLKSLQPSCFELEKADLSVVPQLLPLILDCLRMIWTLAPNYNTPDKIASFIRRISNEVIKRCRHHINCSALFSGQDLDTVDQALQQSIDTVGKWKEIYLEAASRLDISMPERNWSFLNGSSFAHVDAFVQRCQDLQEMSAAYKQFNYNTQITSLLSGPKAAEMCKALTEVRRSFQDLMQRFQNLQYDVLDVKVSQWYEDMAAFRSVTRDLELFLGNVIENSYKVATNLNMKLEVLEAFYLTATRKELRKTIEERLVDWHTEFMQEIKQVRNMFESVKEHVPVASPLPAYAGQALLMKGMQRRIQQTWDTLQGLIPFLPAVPILAESSAGYEALHAGLLQCINTLNAHWYRSIAAESGSMLNDHLLRQDPATGNLFMNMDEKLVTILEEAYLFERLRLGVPGTANDLMPQRHRLLAERSSLVQLVIQYNHLLQNLVKDERRLLKDRIRYLDRRVLPGVNKLQWSHPKHQVDYFQREAMKACKGFQAEVLQFKSTSAALEQSCTYIRASSLVSVERKKVYELGDFNTENVHHQRAVQLKLVDAYSKAKEALVSLYKIISRDSEVVQQEYLRLVQRVDVQLLEAMTAAVRKSLHELARSLNGAKRGAEVPPVFVLQVILESDNRVELKPTLQDLFLTVAGVSKRAVSLLDSIPRLTRTVFEECNRVYGVIPACIAEVADPPSYAESIQKNEDAVLKQLQGITSGITSVIEKVQQFLVYFEKKFRHAYEQDRETFIRRYERAGKPAASFEADIRKFRDLSDEVLMEENAGTVRFLRLDCAPLKQTLVAHCESWISQFQACLHNMAAKQVAELYDSLVSYLQRWKSSTQLNDRKKLRKEIDKDALGSKVISCQERYSALERLQVSLGDDEIHQLQQVHEMWADLEQSLIGCQTST